MKETCSFPLGPSVLIEETSKMKMNRKRSISNCRFGNVLGGNLQGGTRNNNKGGCLYFVRLVKKKNTEDKDHGS